MNVLSGSSTRKIAPKAIAITARSTLSNLSGERLATVGGRVLSQPMTTFDHYDQGTPSWVELSTPDQSAAREFYSGLFGWDYDDNDMGEMGHYYIATYQGSQLGGLGGQPPG